MPQKSFESLWLLSPNRYEIDLSNEVLNVDFGQEAEKISEVKVGGGKKYLKAQSNPISIGLML